MNTNNINIGSIVFFAIIGLIGILLLWFFIFKVKHLKTPDVFCVDGGVKTGKSLVCVMLAIKQYRMNVIKVAILNFFRKVANKVRSIKDKPIIPLRERPMLYSNMPLNRVKYNDLTLDIILRKVRIPYKSVVLIDEASLLADAMSGAITTKDKKERFDYVNENLTLFIKLFGHATRGGSCFYNSQQIIDLHFAFKRCTSTYLFISKNKKYPFFCLLDVRECVHSEDGDTVNTIQQDVDVDAKPLFVSKRYYKYYDRYYLSVLTDKLPVQVNYDVIKYIKHKDMKAKQVITLGEYKSIKEFNERSLNNA